MRLNLANLMGVAMLVVLGLPGSGAYAQKQRTKAEPTPAPAATSAPSSRSEHMQVYSLARSYNDFRAAANALYYEITAQPDNMGLKDSLSVMFFAMGANLQAITVGNEVLAQQPENQRVLEIVAVSYQNIGAVKEALDHYERLYKLSESAYHLYQIAVIQYSLKRMFECEQSLQQLLNHPQADAQKVLITLEQNRQQEVVVKAAAYNVLGVLQREAGDLEKATKSFEQALALDKDFVLPKANLEDMQKAPKK
jgi:tetratricopeptide (TPR) repeat protein